MTSFQTQLIERLTTAKSYKVAKASFNGDFLNCEAHVLGAADSKGNRKIKKQKFSFVFEEPEHCCGCRAVGRNRGAYSDAYQKAAFGLICEFEEKIGQLEVDENGRIPEQIV